MVDAVSTRVTALASWSGIEPARSAASGAGVAVRTAAESNARSSIQAEVGSVAQSLSAKPPVNGEKVSEIRAAIRAGNYPVEPYTIAESMIRSLRGL